MTDPWQDFPPVSLEFAVHAFEAAADVLANARSCQGGVAPALAWLFGPHLLVGGLMPTQDLPPGLFTKVRARDGKGGQVCV